MLSCSGISVIPVESSASWTTLDEGVDRHVPLHLVSQDEPGVVVYHRNQVIVAPAYDSELGCIGGLELVGACGLVLILFARCHLVFHSFHQTFPPQDTIDRGGGDR